MVIGYGADHCPKEAYQAAYEVGSELAKRGVVVLTGGLGGVMEAANKGAREAGGLSIGIIPQESKEHANPFCDVVIAAGIGKARDFTTAYSADAVIVVGGGVGSLIEASVAYEHARPVVTLAGSGGTADKLSGTYLDDRKVLKIESAPDPKQAVDLAIRLCEHKSARANTRSA